LDTGFNTALITDPRLRRRFHGDPAFRPVLPGPGEPLEEALDAAGIAMGEIYAVAVSHLHNDHAGGLKPFPGRGPVPPPRAGHDPVAWPALTTELGGVPADPSAAVPA